MDSRPLGDPRQVNALVKALAKAKQPLIVSGSGVIWSRAWNEMQAFVEAAGIPFYTTPQGRGVVPDDHPYSYLTMRIIGVPRRRSDHRTRHADELHHRPRRAAALRRQREDRPHRHRCRGDRDGGALRRHSDRRRLQDGAGPAARRHQGQGDADSYKAWRQKLADGEAQKRIGGRRQQVRRGRRHPSGAHAGGGQELRQARRDPVRRRAGDAELRPSDDADVLAGPSAELRTVRHDGRRPAVRRRRQGGLPGQAGDRGARRRLDGHERDGDGHRDPAQDSVADRDQPERRLDRRSEAREARPRPRLHALRQDVRGARAATANTSPSRRISARRWSARRRRSTRAWWHWSTCAPIIARATPACVSPTIRPDARYRFRARRWLGARRGWGPDRGKAGNQRWRRNTRRPAAARR